MARRGEAAGGQQIGPRGGKFYITRTGTKVYGEVPHIVTEHAKLSPSKATPTSVESGRTTGVRKAPPTPEAKKSPSLPETARAEAVKRIEKALEPKVEKKLTTSRQPRDMVGQHTAVLMSQETKRQGEVIIPQTFNSAPIVASEKLDHGVYEAAARAMRLGEFAQKHPVEIIATRDLNGLGGQYLTPSILGHRLDSALAFEKSGRGPQPTPNSYDRTEAESAKIEAASAGKHLVFVTKAPADSWVPPPSNHVPGDGVTLFSYRVATQFLPDSATNGDILDAHTLIHEYGHHVHFTLLGMKHKDASDEKTKDLLRRIEEEHEKHRMATQAVSGHPGYESPEVRESLYKKTGLISKYAAKDPHEFFAESWLAYHTDPLWFRERNPAAADLVASVRQHFGMENIHNGNS